MVDVTTMSAVLDAVLRFALRRARDMQRELVG
jgi:hypothetical protein